MHTINLFLYREDIRSLDALVEAVSSMIDLKEVTFRDSSHYPEERYAKGTWNDYELIFSLSDEEEIDKYDYWICIESDNTSIKSIDMDKDIDSLVKDVLLPNNFSIVKAIDFGKNSMKLIQY